MNLQNNELIQWSPIIWEGNFIVVPPPLFFFFWNPLPLLIIKKWYKLVCKGRNLKKNVKIELTSYELISKLVNVPEQLFFFNLSTYIHFFLLKGLDCLFFFFSINYLYPNFHNYKDNDKINSYTYWVFYWSACTHFFFLIKGSCCYFLYFLSFIEKPWFYMNFISLKFFIYI